MSYRVHTHFNNVQHPIVCDREEEGKNRKKFDNKSVRSNTTCKESASRTAVRVITNARALTCMLSEIDKKWILVNLPLR